MRNPSLEPLLITAVTGIFLLVFLIIRNQVFTAQPVVIQVRQKIQPKEITPPVTIKLSGDSLKKAEPDSGVGMNTYIGMDPFFESLQQIPTDNTTIHIAYFGDSMIEGDLVTHPLRRRLQKRFGGNGIGFIPVTSPQPGFRTTIIQHFNDEWKVYSFMKSGIQHDIFPGLSGYVFETQKGAEVTFRSEQGYGRFHQGTILYGGRNTFTASVMTDSLKNDIVFPSAAAVASFMIKPDTAFSVFNLKIITPEPAIIYGVNFENGTGVYVDNYAFRGNSGLPLRQIPVSIFSGFNANLRNKLIIIHYGLNVFTPGVADYNWYEQAMRSVISHVKASSPGIPILVISMPDRAALICGEYFTPAELPDFIRLQKRVADYEQVAFFNLFDAMGGVNSMRNWVEGKTKLAGDDYTHPNGSGAGRIAELIYQYLMTGFYQFQQPHDSITAKLPFKPL
ncbi:MAG: GDSL-type esterase/lipase family protein [Bacteroidota bacterium]